MKDGSKILKGHIFREVLKEGLGERNASSEVHLDRDERVGGGGEEEEEDGTEGMRKSGI